MASKFLMAVRRGWYSPDLRRRVLLAFLIVFTFTTAVLAAAWTLACAGNSCPSMEALKGYSADQASKVYAADGRLITDLGLERRSVVPLSEMSPAIIDAFINTEDKRFYEHNGVDWHRVFGALANIVLKQRVTGASTITMQLAGNLWPEKLDRRSRSLGRKLREMKVAVQIEKQYPKDKILELYLNQINLGNRAYGVEAASQRYFGKSARDLNTAEAATLAAIPKAPERYNPRRHPNYSVQRRNVVINLLRDNGRLSEVEAEKWKAYPLLLSSRSDYTGVADYFVEYVRQILDARFGDDLYTQGYRIYTTLDLDMQQSAERALEAQLEAVEGGKYGKFPHQTYAQYQQARSDAPDDDTRPNSPYLQGLLVSLEAKTGYVRALVGGRDFEDSKFNRVNQSRRQPGSTFKPLTYAAAIESGVPLSHLEIDTPLTMTINPDEPDWAPQNYDLKFEGPMTLRQALYESRNIPTIRLGLEIGEQSVVSEAAKFGLTTRIPAVPSMFIGSADVIPLEMIAAYTTFANLGVRTKPQAILRVEDRNGRIVYQPAVQSQAVLDPAHAWLITDVLRDVVRRGTAAGSVGSQITFAAGGKTGTTNDYNDVWYIGFTPDLVTGLWMGFDQPKKIMPNAQGGRLAAPAWTQMMKEVYERRAAPGAWDRPDGLTLAEIDRGTGGLATPLCPKESRYVESFLPGTEPSNYCPLHTNLFGLPNNGSPLNPGAQTTPAPAGVPAIPGVQPPRPSGTATRPGGAPTSPNGTTTGVMGGTGPAPR
jgi:penicillin-binding protein 1A